MSLLAYVKYFEYLNLNDFNNDNFHREMFLPAPKISLVHSALTLSLTYSINSNYKEIRNLNTSLISVLLETIYDESGRQIHTKTDAYKNAESTFKTSFSFYLGMLFASLVAKEIYKIPLVYHVSKNNKISADLKKGKSAPDFIGVLDNGGYLFEAKGSEKKIKDSVASKGKDQLNNITRLERLTQRSTQTSNTIPIRRKQVVGTDFTYNKYLTVHDIDPTPEGKLELDLDSLSLLYYRNHILLFDAYMKEAGIESYRELLSIDYSNNKYYVIPYEDMFIGIEFNLYKYLEKKKSYYYEELINLANSKVYNNILNNSHSQINEIISEVVIDDSSMIEGVDNLVYKGRDGILVLQRDQNFTFDKNQYSQELKKINDKLKSRN